MLQTTGPWSTPAYGPVRGVDNGAIKAWKGIRYAAAPVSDLRWRAPMAPQRWSEPADATRVGPVCPQPTDPRIPIDLGAPQGDDCLTLNVWASSDTEAGDSKPVMVWLHGGAYILGSSAQSLYHGGALAGSGDAVIVTVNYRFGALGFLTCRRSATASTPTSDCATCCSRCNGCATTSPDSGEIRTA